MLVQEQPLKCQRFCAHIHKYHHFLFLLALSNIKDWAFRMPYIVEYQRPNWCTRAGVVVVSLVGSERAVY